MSTPRFVSHHVTVSVRDIETSIEFYAHLGFRPVLRWTSEVDGLQIAHLALGGTLLELFAYTGNADAETLELTVGNDLHRIGVRHFGLSVENLAEARASLLMQRCEVTEIRRGRTRIDFFYVKDPDGNWIEIVHDERALSPEEIETIVKTEA